MTQITNLSISDNSNRTIPVIINDILDSIAISSTITEIFLKAVTAVVTKYLGGLFTSIVTAIVVEIGAGREEIEIQQHRRQVVIRIKKLEITTEECANAIRRAEQANHLTPAMKQELVDRLSGLFYEEMAKIAPKRN